MRTFSKAPIEPGAHTLDARWYISPEVFAQEAERIFARSWIGVGRSADLGETGSYFLADIAGESLIITRDPAGRARALYNVCRHRGTRLCTEQNGRLKGVIQCPYHAWTYGLDGTLLAARNMDATPQFDREAYPLRQAPIVEWEGFLFVSLQPEKPFEETFAPLMGRFNRWELSRLRCAKRITYDVRCNWKLVFQNYSECYHCPVIHPQLERLSPWESGRNDLMSGPFLGGYMLLRDAQGSLTVSGHTSRAPLPGLDDDETRRVYYYTLFPSMLLSLHPDYAMVHFVDAKAPDRTTIVCEWLFDPQTMSSPNFDPSDAVDFWDMTNRQDWQVSELTQLGVRSRAYAPGPYSSSEGLLHAFDRHYLSIMQ
ncbi:MAG: aromatic ring-hydroxylating dioxygenase subunit alpha [Candidatus Eremiobacteraeota bacterium]|nr:aromatic ring-hydroxylating dioxygenase subunit alpha [Candidatus Eremiobacteraeota bacterium]